MPLPFHKKYFIPLVHVTICWIIVLIDIFLKKNEKLSSHGIYPRKVKGLIGVLVAPFMHSSVLSMVNTTFGLLIFGWLLLRRSIFDFFIVTILCLPLSGIVYWIVGVEYVVGAGGLICSWFGYLVAIPFFERPIKFSDLGIAVAAAIIYIVILIFIPGGSSISGWVYNICGLAAGVLISVLRHKLLKKTFQHFEEVTTATDTTKSTEPSDTTRLLDTPVANNNKPASSIENSNPFENA